jgi:hypothetical protein
MFITCFWQEQDIGWAEPCEQVSFNIEEEEYLKKAREAGKREGCLLRRKPPHPSGETKGRLVFFANVFFSFSNSLFKVIVFKTS